MKPTDSDELVSMESKLVLHRMLKSSPEPPFEEAGEQESVWGRRWGIHDDVGQIRMVLLCKPGAQWRAMTTGGRWVEEAGSWIDPDHRWYWMGKKRLDLGRAREEHEGLAESLQKEGAEVVYLVDPPQDLHHSVFTRDAGVVLPSGAVICRMGTRYRRGEEQVLTRTLGGLGMPILLTIHGRGLLEGGSFAMLNRNTAALGLSHRINPEGARQLEGTLSDLGIELILIDLPGSMYHLDGIFVMVDHDKALINYRYLSRRFQDRLGKMGIQSIEVDPEEGPFALNCLAVRPGRVLMSDHAVRTAEALNRAGVEPILIRYGEICKAGGGIHCSTLPLIRD